MERKMKKNQQKTKSKNRKIEKQIIQTNKQTKGKSNMGRSPKKKKA